MTATRVGPEGHCGARIDDLFDFVCLGKGGFMRNLPDPSAGFELIRRQDQICIDKTRFI